MKYQKVKQIGDRSLTKILVGPVIVEEKIDGSQFNFTIENGSLRCFSKNRELLDPVDKMFKGAVDTCNSIKDLLLEGWVYSGECLHKRRHNKLLYDRTPTGNIILFDIRGTLGKYLDPVRKQRVCKSLGLECVPLLFQGEIENLGHIESLAEQESVLGGCTMEGVVIKNYPLIGKYVRPSFRETKGKIEVKSKDVLLHLIEEYKSEARWEKAVQHMAEDGVLQGEVRDIGPAIKYITADILEECEEEIKEALFKWAWKHIHRGVIDGFPAWYKDKLLKTKES